MLAPINSVKHIVNYNLAATAAAAITNNSVATAVVSPDANNSGEVVEGAIIKAVYIEIWITSDDAASAATVVSFEKIPAAATPQTYAQSLAMFSYPNKKNIFYTSEGLIPPNVQSGLPLLRGWFKVPKGKQRMGLGDKLLWNISGIGNGLSWCGLAIYKEYR